LESLAADYTDFADKIRVIRGSIMAPLLDPPDPPAFLDPADSVVIMTPLFQNYFCVDRSGLQQNGLKRTNLNKIKPDF